MGKLHWQRHAEKPEPVGEYLIDDEPNVKVVIRRRADSHRSNEKYVATIRYVNPPRPGQLVITYAYGRTRREAELRALSFYYDNHKAQAR